MAGSVWDNMSGGAQQRLGQYQNVVAFFQAVPYRPGDIAGQKLEDALTEKTNFFGKEYASGIDKEFAGRLDRALADPAVRQGVADLPPDIMAANVDRVIASPESLPRILAEVRAAPAVQSEPEEAPAAPPPPRQSAPEAPAPKMPDASSTVVTASTGQVETPVAETPVVESVEPSSQSAPVRGVKLDLSPDAVAPAGQTGEGRESLREALLKIAAGSPDEQQKQMLTDIANARGLDGLEQRLEANPDLGSAVSAHLKDGMEGRQSFLEKLHGKLQEDPDYINKVNKMIDNAPPQMLSSMAREVSANPDADLFAQLEQGMKMSQMSQMMQSLANSPFGKILLTVCESIMGMLGPILKGLGLGDLAKTMNEAIQGFSRGPRHIATSDPQGRTPLADNLDRANGATPQTIVTGPEGRPVAPAPTPSSSPAPGAGQDQASRQVITPNAPLA